MKMPAMPSVFKAYVPAFGRKERKETPAAAAQLGNAGFSNASGTLPLPAVPLGAHKAGAENMTRLLRVLQSQNTGASPVRTATKQTLPEAEFTPASAGSTVPLVSGNHRVVDPRSHEINKEYLKDLSQNFKDYFDKASNVLGQTCVNKLQAELGKLSSLADWKNLDQAKLGFAVRDCYKHSAEICGAQAITATGEKKQALLGLQTFFDELKRHHLSAAATPVFTRYADEETARMKGINPGMVSGRAGSAVINQATFELGISGGIGPAALGAGLGLESAHVKLVDEDHDQNDWNMLTTKLTLSAGDSLGPVSLKAQGKLALTTGTNYTESGSYTDQTKIVAKNKANGSVLPRLMPSAGPKTRKLMEGIQTFEDAVKAFTTGAPYQAKPVPLYLNEKKVAKGAYNTHAIHLMASNVDGLLASGRVGRSDLTLKRLVEAAYPERHDIAAGEKTPPVSAMAYAPISLPAGGAGKRGKEGVSITTLDGALDVTAGIAGTEDIPYFVNINAGGNLRRREFDTEDLRPTHGLTSGGYTKDMRVTLDLWNAVEHAFDENHPKLSLYRDVNSAFKTANDTDRASTHDIGYFGPTSDIPDIFLGTIRARQEKLGGLADAVTEQCEKLHQVYAQFEPQAGALYAQSRPGDSQGIKKVYSESHHKAFEDINHRVWDDRYQQHAGVKEQDVCKPGRAQREFVADSYDAISTALGGVGTHLEIIKAKIAETPNLDPALLEKVEKADASYKRVSEAVDAANIPMRLDTLHRYSTIAWPSHLSKNEAELHFQMAIGPNLDIDSLILEETTDIETSNITADLRNNALGLKLGVSAKLTQTNHPNLCRAGEFADISVSIGAGNPLAGLLVEKAVLQAVRKIEGIDPKVKFPEMKEGSIQDICMKHGMGAVLDSSQSCIVALRFHKFAESADNKMQLQYFRILEQQSNSIAPSVSAPLLSGLTGAAGMRVAQDIVNPLYERMGPDLAHHLLSSNNLNKLYQEASQKAKQQAPKDPASGKSGDALVQLRMLLEREPNQFWKSQYFGSHAIFEVVKDYRAFLDWKKDGSGEPPRNGFAFYDGSKIQDLAKNARKVDSLAAGKPLEKQQRPSLSELLPAPDADALKRVEEALSSLKDDDQRADFFLKGAGRDVFETYRKVIGNYAELNMTASMLLGFDGQLRGEEPNSLKRVGQAARSAGNQLSSLKSNADAGRTAEKVLHGRGYFAEGKKVDYDDLMAGYAANETSAKESAEKTKVWLERHNLHTAQNGATGMHGLIIAHLQHVTGRYDNLHVDEAAKYLKMVGSNASSTENMEKIVKQINKDHGKDVQTRVIAPGKEGTPVWTSDLDARKAGSASSTVIFREQNDKGEETFAAVVHQGKATAGDVVRRQGVSDQLSKLQEARDTRAKIIDKLRQADDPNAPKLAAPQKPGMTGAELRNAMKELGAQRRGFMKNTVAKLADMKRPDRKTVRDLSDEELASWIAKGYEKGNKTLWQEAIKEEKKRKEMKLQLSGSETLAGITPQDLHRWQEGNQVLKAVRKEAIKNDGFEDALNEQQYKDRYGLPPAGKSAARAGTVTLRDLLIRESAAEANQNRYDVPPAGDAAARSANVTLRDLLIRDSAAGANKDRYGLPPAGDSAARAGRVTLRDLLARESAAEANAAPVGGDSADVNE